MPTIQVREVPDHIYRTLAEEAKRERRSLAQQVVATLARGLEVEVDPRRVRLDALARVRARGAVKGILDHTKLIREDRQR
jgi:hypothetical protein